MLVLLSAIFKRMERPLPEVDGTLRAHSPEVDGEGRAHSLEVDGEGRAALLSLRRSRLTLALDGFENGCKLLSS